MILLYTGGYIRHAKHGDTAHSRNLAVPSVSSQYRENGGGYMSRKILLGAVVLALTTSFAFADLSRGVIAAFKGQLVISKSDLPEGKNDKDTIGKIKAAKLSEVTGTMQQDVAYWNFHYTAFLN